MKYRHSQTNIVVEHDPSYVAVFPDGMYVPVGDEALLTEEPCCGGVAYDVLDEDELDELDTLESEDY